MTLRAGIVGAGGIAGFGILGLHDEAAIGEEPVRASHAGGYREAAGVELVAVADVDAERLERFGEAWDVPEAGLYGDHRAMLREADLDLVSVCTPTLYHAEHVVDAAEIAAPEVVWCEKPIATGLAEADEMIDACEAAGTELVINHSFRFTEKLRRLREFVVEEDLLGEVHAVATQFRMELVRNSTHLLDTLVYLLDARPARVAGYVTGENEAVEALGGDQRVDDAGGGGFLVTEDGTFVTVDCTVPRADSSMTLQFLGSGGKLYMNNDDGEWRYWRLEDGEHVEADLPGIEGAWTWEQDYEEAFPNAAAHVAAVARGEAENRSPGRAARRSLAVIVGFYVSHYTGGQVTYPLADPLTDVRVTSW